MKMWLSQFFIALIAVLAVIDIWVAARYSPEATLSVQLYEWASRYPIIAFMLGVLVGHVFWPISLDK